MEKKKSRRWLIIAVAILVIAAAVAIILLITKKKDSYRVIKIYEIEGAAFVQRDGVDDLEPYANMLLKSGFCLQPMFLLSYLSHSYLSETSV